MNLKKKIWCFSGFLRVGLFQAPRGSQQEGGHPPLQPAGEPHQRKPLRVPVKLMQPWRSPWTPTGSRLDLSPHEQLQEAPVEPAPPPPLCCLWKRPPQAQISSLFSVKGNVPSLSSNRRLPPHPGQRQCDAFRSAEAVGKLCCVPPLEGLTTAVLGGLETCGWNLALCS